MTAIQVFEYYCRVHRIKPFLIEDYNKNAPIDWGRVETSRHRLYDDLPRMNYYDTMKNHIKSSGFQDLVYQMSCGRYHSLRKRSEIFKAGATKWFRFSKNNIKYNPNSIKVGDVVEYSSLLFNPTNFLPGNESSLRKSGIVEQLDPCNCTVTISYHDSESVQKHVNLSVNRIKTVNGRKFKLDFVITKRKKIIAQ